jgi:hypothetical protein
MLSRILTITLVVWTPDMICVMEVDDSTGD